MLITASPAAEPPTHPTPLDGATNVVASPLLAWSGLPSSLGNGGFESALQDWRVVQPTFQSGQIYAATNLAPLQISMKPVVPLEGTRMAVMRISEPGQGTLEREFVVPNTGRPVRLVVGEWLRLGNYNAPQNPRFEGSSELSLWASPNVPNTEHRLRHIRPPVRNTPVLRGWTRHAIDITEYAGLTVRLVAVSRSVSGAVEQLLDDVRLETGEEEGVEYEVRLASHPQPGPADLLAITRDTAVPTPLLKSGGTYHWQVFRRQGGDVTPGPVWSFTVGADGVARSLAWGGLRGPVVSGNPASAALQARDIHGRPVSDITGPARLTGLQPSGKVPRLLFSEVIYGSLPSGSGAAVEVANVDTVSVPVGGWKVTVWDQARWPEPVGTVVLPANASLQPSRGVVVRSGGAGVGAFPNLNLGKPLYWTPQASNQLAAALLQDPSGAIVDFVALGGADPTAIQNPVAVPAWQWMGPSLPGLTTASLLSPTWQRWESRDTHSAADWHVFNPTTAAIDRRVVRPFSMSWEGTVVTPAEVPIAAGNWQGNLSLPSGRVVDLVAFTPGGLVGSRVLTVSSNPPVTVELASRLREDAGTVSGGGRVRLPSAAAAEVTIQLTSSVPGLVGVPGSVTIPAGATEGVFDLTVTDDGLRNGTREVWVTPSAAGYAGIPTVLRVDDTETAVLGLQLPAEAVEGDLAPVAFLTVNPAPDQAVRARVSFSVPGTPVQEWDVVLPAGATSVPFRFSIPDDRRLDGARNVAVSARVENWTPAEGTLALRDDERAELVLTLPATVSESNQVLAQAGRVTLGGLLPTNVVVQLVSSYPQRVQLPSEVVVPAGQFSATFDVTVVDNDLIDGAVTVTASAAAAGLDSDTVSVGSLDNDAARFDVVSIESPQYAVWEFQVQVRPLGPNGGLVTAFRGPLNFRLLGVDPAPPVRVNRIEYANNGVATAWVSIDALGTGFQLRVDDGRNHIGVSSAFSLVEPPYRDVAGSVTDAAWDPVSRRFYLSVPGADAGPGAIVAFHPETRSETGRVEMTPKPGLLAVSGGGEFLYVVTADGGEIVQLALPALELVRRWPVVREDSAPGFVEDLAVQPGNPGVIAVTRYRPNLVPRADGVVIYDQGVRRPNGVEAFGQPVNRIEWRADGGELYGFLNESSNVGFVRLRVDAQGVGVRDVREGVTALQPSLDFGMYGALAVVNDGTVLDPEGGPGRRIDFANSILALAPEPSRQRVYGAVGLGTDTTVRAYDFISGTLVDEQVLLGLYTQFGGVSRLLRWSDDGLAALVAGRFAYWRSGLVPPAGTVDLSVEAEAQGTWIAGQTVTVVLRVKNLSGTGAPDVRLLLPWTELGLENLELRRGADVLPLSQSGQDWVASLGTLAAGGVQELEARFRPRRAGSVVLSGRGVANVVEDVRENNRFELSRYVEVRIARRENGVVAVSVDSLASVPDGTRLLAAQAAGPRLLEINPTNGVVTRTLDLPSVTGPLDRLVVSEDGSRAFVASTEGATVIEISRTEWTVTRSWQASLAIGQGPAKVVQLAVPLGSPSTVAVLLKGLDGVQPPSAVQFYDAGAPRWLIPVQIPLTEIAFGQAGQVLYGLNTQNNGFEVRRFRVTAEGLVDAGWRDRWLDSGRGLIVAGGRVYVSGRVYTDDDSLRLVGVMSGVSLGLYGSVVPEAGLGFHATDGSLTIYDLNRLTLVGVGLAPFDVGVSSRLVRWGPDGLAWFDSKGVALLRTDWLPEAGDVADLELKIETPGVPTTEGGKIRVEVRVRNLGPAEARDVRLNWNLPPRPGEEDPDLPATTDFRLGDMPAGFETNLVVEALPMVSDSPLRLGAWIRSRNPDPNTGNQLEAALLNVVKAGQDAVLFNLPSIGQHAVWDPLHRRFHITLKSLAGRLGNTLVSLDPVTGVFSRPIWVGSEPGRIALAQDSSRLYVALDGSSEVAVHRLPDGAPMGRFSLGVLESHPLLRVVRDSFVVPGHPEQFVASTVVSGTIAGTGVALYRDGVKAPREFPVASPMTVEPDAGSTRFWAADGFNRGASLYHPELVADGINGGTPVGLSDTALGEFARAGTWVVGVGGGLFLWNTPPMTGSLNVPDPSELCAEPDGSRLYVLPSQSAFYVEVYDPANFAFIGRHDTGTGTDLSIGSFQRWGSNGLAYLSPGGLRVFRSPLVPVAPNADKDEDGMPDAWELENGTDPNTRDAGGDLDGDGWDNLGEYQAGTNPKDPASRLELQLRPAEAGGFRAEVEGRPGRRYQLEAASTPAGPWNPVGEPVNGTGSVLSLPLPSGGDSQMFRVRVGL